jgi:mRNA deadenylase 3'-5' endonuclease subunit Ccr4
MRDGVGCCIIYKTKAFKLVDMHPVLFDTSSLNVPPSTDTRSAGLVCRLECIASHRHHGSNMDSHGVVVSSHHLFWPPAAHYEKLRQSLVMLHEVVQLNTERWPMVMCGDFNTCPNDPPYALLTGQVLPDHLRDQLHHVPADHFKKKKAVDALVEGLQGIDVQEFPTHLMPVHDLVDLVGTYPRCKSVYADYDTLHPEMLAERWPGEPAYTNYTVWKGTLDYIFMVEQDTSKGRYGGIELERVLKLPPPSALQPGLPNEVYGSDHLCIMAEFSWVGCKDT